MSFNNDALITIHKKWFDEATPVNGKKSSGVLTFADVPTTTHTVTIGTEVYQFMVAGATPTDSSYVLVSMAATPTKADGVLKLTAAITANSTIVTAVGSTPNDTVTVTYVNVGTEGNEIATTETLTNASWGAVTLTGGVYATPCHTSNATIVIGGVRYIATKPIDQWCTDGWVSCAETAT